MRFKHLLWLMALVPLNVGCLELPLGSGFEIWRYASRNLYEAPIDARDDCMERARYRHMGEKAWEEICRANPGQYSVHYGRGFVDGFADFLFAGGTGEPPVVPPWRYRKSVYETPEGYQAVEDWFAGFRHGAGVAQASGLRNLVLVPVSRLPENPMAAYPPPPPEPTEGLPPPKKLMPPATDEGKQ